jgi:PAS domain S-box-containing protein
MPVGLKRFFEINSSVSLMKGAVLALAAAGVATATRVAMAWLFGPEVPLFASYYPAVLFAALFGGLWAGLFTSALSIVAVWFVFTPPVFVFQTLRPQEISNLLFFGASSVVIVALSVWHRSVFAQLSLNEEARRNLLAEADARNAELQRTAALLETIINLTPDLIFAKDLEGRAILRNRAALFGKEWDDVKGRREAEWHSQTEEALQVSENDRKVIESGRSMQFEEPFTTERGQRILLSTKSPLFDATGNIVGVIGVSTDITEREVRARHVEFIMRELSHRSKNLLAVVQSIARQSARQSSGFEEFEEKFVARLGALTTLHDLLVHNEWDSVTLRAMAEAQTQSLSDRIEIDGPDISLRPACAQVLSMALHELCTNAIKHGALSSETGGIKLHWSLDGADTVHLEWREFGGPPVEKPQRTGFGSTVLERSCLQIIGSTTSIDFQREGFLWRLSAPRASLAVGEPG